VPEIAGASRRTQMWIPASGTMSEGRRNTPGTVLPVLNPAIRAVCPRHQEPDGILRCDMRLLGARRLDKFLLPFSHHPDRFNWPLITGR